MRWLLYLLLLAGGVRADEYAPPPEFAGQLGTLRSPLTFYDGTPVRSAAEWPQRRAEIKARWMELMGPWPPVLTRPRAEPLQLPEAQEGFTQHLIQLEMAPDYFQHAYVLRPPGPGPFAAVLVPFYEPETSIGLRDKPQRDFARQLTRRGFVTLSIGVPGGDAWKPDLAGAQCQPLSYLAYLAGNAANYLASLPKVDPKRIGIVGHSFGGKWAMFGACLNDQFACGAWSDAGILWDETKPGVNYWDGHYLGREGSSPRSKGVLPRTGAYRALVEGGHDLHELQALMAPRPFLVSGGEADGPARWVGLNHVTAVHALLGVASRVAYTSRPMHSPTAESNAAILRFFERWLK